MMSSIRSDLAAIGLAKGKKEAYGIIPAGDLLHLAASNSNVELSAELSVEQELVPLNAAHG